MNEHIIHQSDLDVIALEIKPQLYQWFNPVYRKGYLIRVTARFN